MEELDRSDALYHRLAKNFSRGSVVPQTGHVLSENLGRAKVEQTFQTSSSGEQLHLRLSPPLGDEELAVRKLLVLEQHRLIAFVL